MVAQGDIISGAQHSLRAPTFVGLFRAESPGLRVATAHRLASGASVRRIGASFELAPSAPLVFANAHPQPRLPVFKNIRLMGGAARRRAAPVLREVVGHPTTPPFFIEREISTGSAKKP